MFAVQNRNRIKNQNLENIDHRFSLTILVQICPGISPILVLSLIVRL